MQPEEQKNKPEELTLEHPLPSTPNDIPPTEAQLAADKAAKRTQIMVIAGAIIFLVLLIAAVVLMAVFPTATTVIRDIAIVFVAVETFVIGLVAIVLIFQIQMLIQVLRDEIQPLLQSVNDTASTVRGTTDFMSHNVVSPIIKLAGFTAGVQKITSDVLTVFGGMRPSQHQSTIGGKQDVQAGK